MQLLHHYHMQLLHHYHMQLLHHYHMQLLHHYHMQLCHTAGVGDQEFKLTTNNKKRLSEGFQFDELPATLRDAVIVTSHIGLSYIWIDALCIIQDDEEDKGVELSLLARIYENSAVTIAASRATTVKDDFLGPRLAFRDSARDPFRLQYRFESTKGDGQTSTTGRAQVQTVPVTCFPSVDLLYDTGEPLGKRAWTFQERALSKNLIEFGVLGTRYRGYIPQRNDYSYVTKGWRINQQTALIPAVD
jgi:hypothetical protein